MAFPELLPDWLAGADWSARPAETTRYYQALLDDPVAATKALAADFESLRASLARVVRIVSRDRNRVRI